MAYEPWAVSFRLLKQSSHCGIFLYPILSPRALKVSQSTSMDLGGVQYWTFVTCEDPFLGLLGLNFELFSSVWGCPSTAKHCQVVFQLQDSFQSLSFQQQMEILPDSLSPRLPSEPGHVSENGWKIGRVQIYHCPIPGSAPGRLGYVWKRKLGTNNIINFGKNTI